MCTCMSVSLLVENQSAIYWSSLRTLQAPLSHSVSFCRRVAQWARGAFRHLDPSHWSSGRRGPRDAAYAIDPMPLLILLRIDQPAGTCPPAVSRQIHQSSLCLESNVAASIRTRCSSGVHRCPSGIQLRFRTRIPTAEVDEYYNSRQ